MGSTEEQPWSEGPPAGGEGGQEEQQMSRRVRMRTAKRKLASDEGGWSRYSSPLLGPAPAREGAPCGGRSFEQAPALAPALPLPLPTVAVAVEAIVAPSPLERWTERSCRCCPWASLAVQATPDPVAAPTCWPVLVPELGRPCAASTRPEELPLEKASPSRPPATSRPTAARRGRRSANAMARQPLRLPPP